MIGRSKIDQEFCGITGRGLTPVGTMAADSIGASIGLHSALGCIDAPEAIPAGATRSINRAWFEPLAYVSAAISTRSRIA